MAFIFLKGFQERNGELKTALLEVETMTTVEWEQDSGFGDLDGYKLELTRFHWNIKKNFQKWVFWIPHL